MTPDFDPFESAGDTSQAVASNWKGGGLHIELTRMDETPKKVQMPYRFQCPPLETITTNFGLNHVDYDTVFKGQFSRKGGRRLRTISFSTLAVFYPAGFAVVDGNFDLEAHTESLRAISETGATFWFQMWHEWPYVQYAWPATLRDFSVEERAGEGDTRYFEVEFTEWRDPTTSASAKDKWPKVHKLTKNDTLTKLSTKYYKRAALYPNIAKANKGLKGWGGSTKIVDHPRYEPGDKLKIPAPPKDVVGSDPDQKVVLAPKHGMFSQRKKKLHKQND